jgi:hypothetical protein
MIHYFSVHQIKGKDIPVTGREGQSRLPHFLDSRLTDGREVVSLKRRPLFTPRKIPGTRLYNYSTVTLFLE